MLKQKIFKALPAVILSSLLVAAIIYAWTAPTQNPPSGNVSAPINVGPNTQYKSGALGIGGVLRCYSTAIFDGNVGIGTTAPGAKLDVQGGVIRVGAMDNTEGGEIQLAGGGTNPIFHLDVYNDRFRIHSSGTEKMTITNSGNIGIGTATPQYKLDISGDVRWTGTLQGGSVPRARLTSFPSSCPSGQYVTGIGDTLTCSTPPSGGSGGISGSGTTNYLSKWTGSNSLGNSLIYESSSGNIGIGTATPSQKLDVAGYVRGQSGLCIGNDCRTSWPSGGKCSDWRICVQVSDHGCSEQFGEIKCTPWASEGGGWSTWATDSNKLDPDCVQIKLECR